MAVEVDIDARELLKVSREMKAFPRDADLATLFSLKRVGMLSRTQITRSVAADLSVSQKHVRKRIKIFPGSIRHKFVKIWGGTKLRLRHREIGSAVIRHAPPGSSTFLARMRSGHVGRFYRAFPGSRSPRDQRVRDQGNDLPIREVKASLVEPMMRHLAPTVKSLFNRRFSGLFANDFARRVRRRRGWK